MIFENPNVLWLLVVLPPLLVGLNIWGWRTKKEAAKLFIVDTRHLRKKHIEKYVIFGVLMSIFILMLALPEVAVTKLSSDERTGEVILCVDVSMSMAAQKDIDSLSRIERAKPILYEIIDQLEEWGQVKISLCGFTGMARSLVPLVGKEDYSYLRESIKTILDIYSVPGVGTSLAQPIISVVNKYSKGEKSKLLILISDGEYYSSTGAGKTQSETYYTDIALQNALSAGVKIITIGIGELEGAKIPLYDIDGYFTGKYSQVSGEDYVSYLYEEDLQEYASRTYGKYFFENNLVGLTKFIEDNLSSIESGENTRTYHSIANWFLLASLPIWVFFIKRYILD